jgi:hypothetical protein
LYIQIFFAKSFYFNLNAEPANPSLALHHNLTDLPPTHMNSSRQHLISLPACPASKQELFVIMEKERCQGCDKWFARIEQHLTYHNHCRSVMVEHPRQQRLECHNRNNGMDPLIGTIVVASTPEVNDGMSTGMSTRGAKRQQSIEQEDDNQSNVTFEGFDIVDDFGPIIPSPSGEADSMEVDLHSRGCCSLVP